jgi:uncharacterized membrane protein YedE/YeeE
MRARTAGALVGVVFGVTLSWSGMTSPTVIRQALLFEKSYLFLFMASAMLTAFVGQRVLRAVNARAVLTGEPIAWQAVRPQRRHIVGSVLFGIGWGVADVCPGPVATQLGQGIAWSLLTLAGITIGIVLFRRREARAAAPAESSALAPAPGGQIGATT